MQKLMLGVTYIKLASFDFAASIFCQKICAIVTGTPVPYRNLGAL
jgi:hypothetical protein